MDINVLWVFLISAAPIGELRLGIPWGIEKYDLSWAVVVPVALFGNLLVIPLLLVFLERALTLMYRIGFLTGILDWIFERTRKRGEIVNRYHGVGLFLLVAIPLPGTGAWTGSLAASLLGIEFKRALLPIVGGVLVAGAIVSILTALGWIGAAIAGICLIILAGFRIWQLHSRR
ncbi:COG2426 family protein [Chloroflexota bacterium]